MITARTSPPALAGAVYPRSLGERGDLPSASELSLLAWRRLVNDKGYTSNTVENVLTE